MNSIICIILFMILSGCGFKISSSGEHGGTIISGLIPSLLGSQAIYSKPAAGIKSLSTCTATAQLFKIESNGSINEFNLLATVEVGPDARYSFNSKELNLTNKLETVNYLIKIDTCNGDFLNRPVTDFNSNQDVNAKTTVISAVVNINGQTPKKLNESTKSEIENLINSISGSTTSTALNSLITNSSAQFLQIFGVSALILKDSMPEVKLTTPFVLNELATAPFVVNSFHIDPTYSFAYSWKLDGVVVASTSTWNFIPHANSSGTHQIDVYIGKNDGLGSIDLTKPYYSKTFNITVNNNILPVAPDIVLNSTTPTPRNTNNIKIDFATGIGFSNCANFSYLAVTDTNTAPGIMQFNIQCTTVGTQTETITFSNSDGIKNLYVWAMDNVGQISNSKTVNFILDTSPPAATVNIAEANLKGGNSYDINFSASDAGSGLDTVQLYFSNDNVNYNLLTTVSNSAVSYNWTVPVIDTANAKIKLIATDLLGFTTTVYTNTFAIDSTNPVVTITNPAANGSLVLITDLINYPLSGTCSENGIPVQLSGISTTTAMCNAGLWSLNLDLTGQTDGVLSLTANQTDIAGNMGASTARNFIKDTTLPVLNITNLVKIRGNGNYGSLNFTLTEQNIQSATNFTIDIFDGTSWSNIGTVLAIAGNNISQGYSLFNFSVPNVNISNAKIRISITDQSGNQTIQQSADFVIDSAAPVISSVVINDGAVYAGTSLVNVKVNMTDNFDLSGLFVKLKMANTGTNDCQSEYTDSDWLNYISATSNISFLIPPVDGVKKICAWSKDSLGNISLMNPTVGSTGMNFSTITFQTGNLPQLTNISILNTGTGNSSYTISAPTTISWSATDTEGLDDNPVAIAYSTDGVNWLDIVTNQNFLISSNMTWLGGLSGNPTSASGSYTLFTAPSSSFFIIKAVIKDTAGNIGIPAQSQPQNVNGWSVFAGTTERGDGGSGTSAALFHDVGGMGQTMAVDPQTNNIYTIDAGVGLKKLDIQTGKVSTYIMHGAYNLGTSGTINSNTSRIYVYGTTQMIIKPNGIMYLGSKNNQTQAQSIYKVDLNTNQYNLYFGGGLDNSTSATPTTMFISIGTFDVDDTNNLYFFTDCNTASPGSSTPKKIMKLSQNPDGTAGVFTHIAGNCTNAAITYGQTAVSQPASTSALHNYSSLSSIAVVDSNLIYFTQYGQNPMKISNGILYSASIGANSAAGIVTYNRINQKMYRSVAGNSVSSFVPVSGVNGGETLTALVASNGTGNCMNDGIDASLSCVTVDSGFSFDANGNYFFIDGVRTNAPNGYRVRYVDSTNKVRTIFGSLPFYGEGLDAGFVRGKISGIYYKKSTEPNLTAFPEGLYLMSPHMVFGRIDSVTNKFQTLFGSQQAKDYTIANGTVVSPNIPIGIPYGGGNGYSLTFDSDGLPWMRGNNQLININSSNQVVHRTGSSGAYWENIADGINPMTTSMWVYAGYDNLVTKNNNGAFISSVYGYLAGGLDPTPQIRFLNYSNSTSNKIIGGTYLFSQNTPMTADITTPGGVKNAPFASTCSNASSCKMQYITSQDRLYFSNSADNKLRYISNPTDTANSTLTTMPLQFIQNNIYNFIFSEDLSQIFYITASGLYCMDISSGKAWCNNTTNLYPYYTKMGYIIGGPNQMTWKSSNKLLISLYSGKILQYELPP